MNAHEQRIDAALSLALDGFWAVPMLEGHKEPLGREWQKHATGDPAGIRAMLNPAGRQFGVFPPPRSRLLVIDFDVPEDYDRLAPLIPETLIVKTAKGWHVYGRLPDGIDEADVPRTFEGGEVRIAGSGQVVGPYGIHPSGATYEPLNGTLHPAILPVELIEALQASHAARTGAQRAARGPGDDGWMVAEPGRHDFLVSRGRNMRGHGVSGQRLVDELLRLNAERCSPPKTPAEVGAIAEWVEHNISDDPPGVTLVANGKVVTGETMSRPNPVLASIDAVDLLALNLPPLRMIVPDLVPEGTTVIASPPKVGKSCLVYQIAVEVAIGGELFGKRVSPGSVLYLALEDGQRRGQERLNAALEGRTLPRDRLTVQWGARKIGEGLEDDIRAWLNAHPDAAVVAIDTLQRVRAHQTGRRNAYEVDVEDLARLQDLFRDRRVALLIVHHSRKDAADDFLASVSGTYGITGSVDTIVVIRRKRLEALGVILATGRDIPEAEVPVRFDGFLWHEAPESLPEARFERAEVYRVIVDQGPIFPAAIAEQTGQSRQAVQKLVGKLADSGAVARRLGGYEAIPRARVSLVAPVSLSERGESDQRNQGHEGAQKAHGQLHHTCHGCRDPILDLADAFFDGASSTFWHREHWEQRVGAPA